jgi:hypothetical protein
MVISKTESQKNYYQRQLKENCEEFLKRRKEIKARYYKKTFKNEIIEDDEIKQQEKEFIILKPLNKKLNPLNKSIIKEQTRKTYFKSLNIIYKNYKYKDIDDNLKDEIMKLLSNEKYDNKLINDELNFIKTDLYEIIKSSCKADIRNLYSLITRIRGFANIIKKLYPYINENQTEYNNKRINKVADINVENKMSKLSFKKEDIIEILNNNDLKLTNREKLLFSLFTLFPTRRAIDYNRMLISNEIPKTEKKLNLEKRNNYYYNGEFYFNITKNKEIQHYSIITELKEIIENEILSRSNDYDNHLLLNENNKPYTTSELCLNIMKVYKKIYGIAISAVEIRRLYSTYLKNQVLMGEMTEEEHREKAEMMNHSYEENKKYAY